MQNKLFAIYDDKAQAYLQPFTFTHDEQAVRTFSDCVNSKEHTFSKNPADYTLFSIGVFDDNTAEISSHASQKLINGLECRDTSTE